MQRSFHSFWQPQSASRIPGQNSWQALPDVTSVMMRNKFLAYVTWWQIFPLWRSLAGDGRWFAVRRECQSKELEGVHEPACETVTWLLASPEVDHHAGSEKELKLAALKAAIGFWMFYWTCIVWHICKRRKKCVGQLLWGNMQMVSGESN